MARLRYNFLTGSCTLSNNTITFTVPGVLGPNAIVSGVDYLPLVINPSPFGVVGVSGVSEIVYVNTYAGSSATSATVERGKEGTSSLASTVWPNNTPWSHGTLASDFGVVSGMLNGDFPTPTVSGQILVATSGGVSSPVWSSTIPTTALSGTVSASGVVGSLDSATISGSRVYGVLNNTVSISGSKVYGDLSANANISGSRVYGDLSANATISGSRVISNITATQISGGALQNSVTISGSNVYGALTQSTINGSSVTGNISATQIANGALQASTTISGSQVYGFAGNLTISGSQITGAINVPTTGTISGSNVYGDLSPNATISGSRVYGAVASATTATTATTASNLSGNINTSQINSGALPTGVTISGSKVYGDLSLNATISGGKVYGDLSPNATISGSKVYGDLSLHTTISGSRIVSNILATQISGGALQSSVTISGTQIVTGTVPLSAIVSGSAGQVLVTNSGGVVAWANPVTVYNPTYNTNFPIGDSTNPVQYVGATVSGFSTYMIITKGTVVASGTNGGFFNFNIEPGLNIGSAPPYGTPAWQGSSEIYRMNFNNVLNSTTFFDQRIATGLDPSQTLISYVQMYIGNLNGTLQTVNGYTVYIKVMGIA